MKTEILSYENIESMIMDCESEEEYTEIADEIDNNETLTGEQKDDLLKMHFEENYNQFCNYDDSYLTEMIKSNPELKD